jgi:hypothetical protein
MVRARREIPRPLDILDGDGRANIVRDRELPNLDALYQSFNLSPEFLAQATG